MGRSFNFQGNLPRSRLKRGRLVGRNFSPDRDPLAFYWGGVDYPRNASGRGFMITGANGSGKSTLIQLLMQDVLPLIGQGYRHRALIYDQKRELYSVLEGIKAASNAAFDLQILHPLDERAWAWDIAKDLDDPDIISTVADGLIPPGLRASQPYFRNTAAVVVGAIMEALRRKYPGEWTFYQVCFVLEAVERITALLKSVPATEYVVEQHAKKIDVTFQSVLSEAAGKLNKLRSTASAWETARKRGRLISLRSWAKKGESVLLLMGDPLRDSAIAAFNRIVINFIGTAALNLPDNRDKAQTRHRRTWFFLDELASLEHVSQLPKMLSEGRSKGLAVVLGFHTIGMLRKHYGQEGAANIVGNASNKVFLGNSDPETNQWASDVFGQIREWVPSFGTNGGQFSDHSSEQRMYVTESREFVVMLHETEARENLIGMAQSPFYGDYNFELPWNLIHQHRVKEDREQHPNYLEIAQEKREFRHPSALEGGYAVVKDLLIRGEGNPVPSKLYSAVVEPKPQDSSKEVTSWHDRRRERFMRILHQKNEQQERTKDQSHDIATNTLRQRFSSQQSYERDS